MGLDLRQVVAGILTMTMFVMLGNMIKQEHFNSSDDIQIAVRDKAFLSSLLPTNFDS